MKRFILLLFVILPLTGFTQRDQNEYLEAKRLLSNEQYSSAKAAFATLTDHQDFGRFASFYYALSAYKQGDTRSAQDMWRQILDRYPEWDQKREVLYWLAHSSLAQGQYLQGINYSNTLTNETLSAYEEQDLLLTFLGDLTVVELEELVLSIHDHKFLAQLYVKKVSMLPFDERNIALVNDLAEKWDFEADELSDLPEVKKSRYRVAAMLPFMYDSLENPGIVMNNRLVTDLYHGMLLACDRLDSLGKLIDVIPYDTKRQADTVEQILESTEFEAIDLIVGPLYPKPSTVVANFSRTNRLNMVNPISTNPGVIGDNPYAFLFGSSYITQAKALARKVREEVSNPYGMIFYEQNSRDSIYAAVFRNELEFDSSFQVLVFEALNQQNSRNWLDTLTAQYDVHYTQKEADSLIESGTLLRNRRLRDLDLEIHDALLGTEEVDWPLDTTWTDEEAQGFLDSVSYDDRERPIFYYEKAFHMEKDSIGFVLGATRKNILANGLISTVETRGDSTKLYGYGEWIDFTMVSYEQLERMGVTMIHPQIFNPTSEEFIEFNEEVVRKYGQSATIFHILGFEVIWQLGHRMHEHGKYFQRGLRTGEYYPGYFLEGMKYGAFNDNQVAPIVRLKQAQVEVLNREEYEN